jgi:heptosyltransferase-3
MKTPEKALFIQLRRIGDILMCTPSIRAFKQAFPDCRLDFLTEMPDVLQGNPHINSIIAVNNAKRSSIIHQYKLIKKIRNNGYDLGVDFFANPRSTYYSFFSGASTRLSYGFGHRRWAYNLIPSKPDMPLYSALEKLRLLEAIGIKSDDPRLEFYPSLDDRLKIQSIIPETIIRPVISISPVSRREYRRWPIENYARLNDLLVTHYNAQIVILAGPGEEASAEQLANLADTKPLVPNIRSLGMLGALFEKVSLHIGNDNGPKHIAVACGAPTFTIFGPESPVSWTYPDYARHHWIQAREFCNVSNQIKHKCNADCIKSISVDAAWERIKDMMTSLPSFESVTRKSQ